MSPTWTMGASKRPLTFSLEATARPQEQWLPLRLQPALASPARQVRGANAQGPHVTSSEDAPADAAQGGGDPLWKAQPPPSTWVPSTLSLPPPLPRLDPSSHRSGLSVRPGPRKDCERSMGLRPAECAPASRVEGSGRGAHPSLPSKPKGRDSWGRTAALEVEGARPAGLGPRAPVRSRRQEPAAGCRRGRSSLRAVIGHDFVCGEPGAAAATIRPDRGPQVPRGGPALSGALGRPSPRLQPPAHPQRGPALPSLAEVFSASRGRRPGCACSPCTGDVSCGVQDLLHGFDSKPDKLYLALFEIF